MDKISDWRVYFSRSAFNTSTVNVCTLIMPVPTNRTTPSSYINRRYGDCKRSNNYSNDHVLYISSYSIDQRIKFRSESLSKWTLTTWRLNISGIWTRKWSLRFRHMLVITFFHYLLDMLSVLLNLHTGSWHLLKGFLANGIKHLQNIVIRHFQLAICMSLPLVLHLLLPV